MSCGAAQLSHRRNTLAISTAQRLCCKLAVCTAVGFEEKQSHAQVIRLPGRTCECSCIRTYVHPVIDYSNISCGSSAVSQSSVQRATTDPSARLLAANRCRVFARQLRGAVGLKLKFHYADFPVTSATNP